MKETKPKLRRILEERIILTTEMVRDRILPIFKTKAVPDHWELDFYRKIGDGRYVRVNVDLIFLQQKDGFTLIEPTNSLAGLEEILSQNEEDK